MAPCISCKRTFPPYRPERGDRPGYCGDCQGYYPLARRMLAMVTGSAEAIDERAMPAAIRLVREDVPGRSVGEIYRLAMASIVRGEPS